MHSTVINLQHEPDDQVDEACALNLRYEVERVHRSTGAETERWIVREGRRDVEERYGDRGSD